MVRPAAFGYNEQTAVSNAFQTAPQGAADVQAIALAEFDAAVARLREAGVAVQVFADTPEPVKPDAVFPNNWISTHPDGTVVLYPMHAPNRRLERRIDIVDALGAAFAVSRVIDLSAHEADDRFLEGTGSIVFDHEARIAYACVSVRTDAGLLDALCETLGYTAHPFRAVSRSGQEVYHTNVVMGIGTGFAVVCLDAIPDAAEQDALRCALEGSGKTVVALRPDQMDAFAGNLLAVQTVAGERLVALSKTAFDALEPAQRAAIEAHARLLPLAIPELERAGGGSVRCMLAQNFLPVLAKE